MRDAHAFGTTGRARRVDHVGHGFGIAVSRWGDRGGVHLVDAHQRQRVARPLLRCECVGNHDAKARVLCHERQAVRWKGRIQRNVARAGLQDAVERNQHVLVAIARQPDQIAGSDAVCLQSCRECVGAFGQLAEAEPNGTRRHGDGVGCRCDLPRNHRLDAQADFLRQLGRVECVEECALGVVERKSGSKPHVDIGSCPAQRTEVDANPAVDGRCIEQGTVVVNVQLQIRACAAYLDRQVERLGGHVGGVGELEEHGRNDGTRLTHGHQSDGHLVDVLPTLGKYRGCASDQVPQAAAGVHTEAQRHGFERSLVLEAAEQQIGLLSQPMHGRREKAEHRRFDGAAGCLSESQNGGAVFSVESNADIPG